MKIAVIRDDGKRDLSFLYSKEYDEVKLCSSNILSDFLLLEAFFWKLLILC